MQVWLASRAGPSRPGLSQCMILHVLLSDVHVSMYVWQSRVGDAKWGVAQGTKRQTVENSTKCTETP